MFWLQVAVPPLPDAKSEDAAEEETRPSSITPEPDEFEHIVPQQPRISPSERYKNQGGFVMP